MNQEFLGLCYKLFKVLNKTSLKSTTVVESEILSRQQVVLSRLLCDIQITITIVDQLDQCTLYQLLKTSHNLLLFLIKTLCIRDNKRQQETTKYSAQKPVTLKLKMF